MKYCILLVTLCLILATNSIATTAPAVSKQTVENLEKKVNTLAIELAEEQEKRDIFELKTQIAELKQELTSEIKRIDQIGGLAAFFGTLLIGLFGLFGFRIVKKEALEEVNKVTKETIETVGDEEISKLKDEIEVLLKDKLHKWDEEVDNYKKTLSKLADNKSSTSLLSGSEVDALKDAAVSLSRIKYEKDYDAQDWYLLGIKAQREKDFNSAITFYSEAIEIDNDHEPSYYNRGICHSETGNYEKAIGDFSKSIQLDPDYYKTNLNLSEAYIMNNEFDNAEEALNTTSNKDMGAKDIALTDYLKTIIKICKNEETDDSLKNCKEMISNECSLRWSFNSFEKWLNSKPVSSEQVDTINKLQDHFRECQKECRLQKEQDAAAAKLKDETQTEPTTLPPSVKPPKT